MAELYSFYAPSSNQGKRTLSQAFANMVAKSQFKVLYVELDFIKPSFAKTTQITHPSFNVKEYTQRFLEKGQANMENYILTKEEAKKHMDKRMHSILTTIANDMDFLTMPIEMKDETYFPSIIDEGEQTNLSHDVSEQEEKALMFVREFIQQLKESSYDYVVATLPNDLDTIFTVPVLAESDKIFNVVTPAPARLEERALFFETVEGMSINKEKVSTLMNMTSDSINSEDYLNLLADQQNVHLIPYDESRSRAELSMTIGADNLNLEMEKLALQLGIDVVQTPKKKGFFGIGAS